MKYEHAYFATDIKINKSNFMKQTNRRSLFSFLFVFLGLGFTINAQESNQVAEPDTLYPIIEQLQSDMAVAKKLKISGYVQVQYQKSDTAGISSFAGGNFGSGIDNRILIRRGRVKFAYDNEFAQAVMQFDITEKGLAIKDAYLSVTEPKYQFVSVTGGVFDRPFGYEISYSSSIRESPERSRIFQTLFPGERDLGGKLTLQAPKTSRFNFIKLDMGFFDGNGTTVETDRYKDFIGHLAITKATRDERFKWGIGASYYNGGFAATSITVPATATTPATTSTNVYSMNKVDGVQVFTKESVKNGDKVKREYYGVDAQLSYDWFLGMTQVRAEYLTGTQPSLAGNSSSLTAIASGDAYSRKFNGYYVYLIQNVLQTPLQAVVKYDVYDPNTSVSANEIGKTSTGYKATNGSDVKYSTLGLGLNYRWSSNVKVMAYYDIVSNEKSSLMTNVDKLKDFSKDINDNVFTLRVQYKF
jgi:hypothetical protein